MYIVLGCCDLLKDENTDEGDCEADLHFQAFLRRSHILPASSSLFSDEFSTISIHSTFVSVIFYLLITFYLQATCAHTHI